MYIFAKKNNTSYIKGKKLLLHKVQTTRIDV